jgi:antitoxin (DNA-binding transcriptional repressor) of toxin-antitoxin stability system
MQILQFREKSIDGSIYNSRVLMEVFTIQEWEENFDSLLERVENGEHIGIVKEDGTAAVMIPADDELYRIYTENNNEAQ